MGTGRFMFCIGRIGLKSCYGLGLEMLKKCT